MKKMFAVGLSALALALGVVGISSSQKETKIVETFATYENGDADTYYNGIDSSLTGNNLLNALRVLNIGDGNTPGRRRSTVGYDSMGTSPSGQFKYTDYDPNNVAYDSNGQPYGTKLTAFYSGTSTSNTNREHVWPNTHGGNLVENDIHMPRPTIQSENGSRSHSFYIEGMKSKDGSGWDPAMESFGDETYRGDSARIIFYCMVATDKLTLTDDKSLSSKTNNKYMGVISDMLSWNERYPVTQRERNRNEGAEYLQGNRNPFIDHPEYACKIWGNYNDATKQACGLSGPSLSLSKENASLKVGAQLTLTATAKGGSGSVTWETNNASVASINTDTGNSIVVTAGETGTAKITAKYGTLTAECIITVSESGGSGGEQEITQVTDISSLFDGDEVYIATGLESSDKGLTGYNGNNDATVSTSHSEWKKYTVSIESDKVKLKDGEDYIAEVSSNGFKYGSSGATITLDSEYHVKVGSRFLVVNGSYIRCYTSIQSSYTPFYLYKVNSSSVGPTLQSITLNTDNVTTEFTIGDTFSYSGLVVTAHYDDNTNPVITTGYTVSNPDMTTVGEKTITVSYGGKTASYTINVNSQPVTGITASVSRTYYVGETIQSSDITVKDSNNNVLTNFSFANNGYQFTYLDASSGGALTSKSFADAVSASNKTCSLTVNVQRKNRVAPSNVKDTITASDLAATGTSYTEFSDVCMSSGAVYAGSSAKNSSNIQLKSKDSSTGIISTTSGGHIQSVKINVANGTNTINVYGKDTAYSNVGDLYDSSKQGTLVGSVSSTGTITFTTNFLFVGIRSSNGAVYISSIEIAYGASDSALNLANYVMFEDTNNQCATKFDVAKGYFENLETADRTTFMTSDDYVILTARVRLLAWAKNQGKTITSTNGDYIITTSGANARFNSYDQDSSSLVIIIVAVVSASSLCVLLCIKKRRTH